MNKLFLYTILFLVLTGLNIVGWTMSFELLSKAIGTEWIIGLTIFNALLGWLQTWYIFNFINKIKQQINKK